MSSSVVLALGVIAWFVVLIGISIAVELSGCDTVEGNEEWM